MRLFALLLVPAALFAQQYFPPGTLARDGEYSRFLKALHEPSLWELSQRDPHAEVYRFFWLRPFHHPISVRLAVRTSGSGWIYAHITTGKGGYEPGHINRISHSWMTKGKTQSLLAAFENAGFWNLPTVQDPKLMRPGGAQWIFEGVRDGKYHVIERWSPQAGDPVHAIGTLALRLARFRIHPQDIY
jgi:hypothetical protein